MTTNKSAWPTNKYQRAIKWLGAVHDSYVSIDDAVFKVLDLAAKLPEGVAESVLERAIEHQRIIVEGIAEYERTTTCRTCNGVGSYVCDGGQHGFYCDPCNGSGRVSK